MNEYETRFASNAEQAEYWNEQAGRKWVTHAQAMDALMVPLTDELLARAAPGPGERVLEVGCGSGAVTARVAEAIGAGGRLLAIDISRPLLEAARARCRGIPQVTFDNADAQDRELPPEDFDLLLSRFGVMFFSDPYAAFRNLASALKPEGRLCFVCWAPLERNPWFSVPMQVATRHLGAPEPTPPRAPGPLAFSEADYVREILDRAGWRDIRIEAFETSMASPNSPAQQAAFFLEMGPAARLIAAREPAPETIEALRADLAAELSRHCSGGVVNMGATVQYVSARR